MAETRRRGAALERDLHDAVLAEVEESGYAATTHDRVARRAGTSKPVLYRRWPTRSQMVLEALLATYPAVVAPETGTLAGDLRAVLAAMRASVRASGRRAVLGLLAEPESASGSTVRELLFARGTEVLEAVLQDARRRGELGEAPLSPALVALPLDLARHELLLDGTLPDKTIDTIVDDIVLPLLLARTSSP